MSVHTTNHTIMKTQAHMWQHARFWHVHVYEHLCTYWMCWYALQSDWIHHLGIHWFHWKNKQNPLETHTTSMSTMMWTDLPTHTHTQTYHTHVHECTNKLKHINTHSYTSAMHANNHIAHLLNQHIYTSLPIHIHITMNTTMCHTQTHLYYIHAHLYYIHAHTHYIHEDMNCMHSHYQPKAMIMPHHTHKLHCKLTSKQAQEPCICEQPTQWILQCKEDQQHTYEPDNHSQ